jgi:mono/diheme cytochrome c family protein
MIGVELIAMTRITATACIAFLIFGGPPVSTHCQEAKMPDLKDPKVIEAGHEVFRSKHCGYCHGSDGNGGVNLTKRDLSDPKYVFQAITEGREKNGLRMPAWGGVLTDEEIWEAAAFVMTLTQPVK